MLVHYLNVPYPDDNKMLIANSVNLWAEKKEWTKEELICQLKPMCKSEYFSSVQSTDHTYMSIINPKLDNNLIHNIY